MWKRDWRNRGGEDERDVVREVVDEDRSGVGVGDGRSEVREWV